MFLILLTHGANMKIGETVRKYSPKTGREGPEGEWRGTSTCLISALDGSGWSVPRPGRFTPEKRPRYPLYNEQDLLPLSVSSNTCIVNIMKCQICLFGRS